VDELALTRRAIRGKWNVSAAAKKRAVQEIERILSDINVDDKLKLEAIKTAGLLDRIDLEEQKMHTAKNITITKVDTKELLTRLRELLPNTKMVDDLAVRMGHQPALPEEHERAEP
jgi:hypothetical protein